VTERGRPAGAVRRFFDGHPRLTVWLIAGVAFSGIVCMCLIVGVLAVGR
jgi:hypothetical protein